ncbi:hypothetical protein ONA92_21555 [Mycobacteroides salmoniphilum]|uniref:hypothetical protein n=1 Tax=Mycobacteroides salmoniphilum TaxID=404941 RepID=UPI0035686556
MSADNWTTCHSCRTKRDSDIAEQIAEEQKRLEHAYGTIPQDEYDALRAQVGATIAAIGNSPLEKTFREDYEIHGAETGVVTVSYGGSCTVCGYGTSFEDQHPIPVKAG